MFMLGVRIRYTKQINSWSKGKHALQYAEFMLLNKRKVILMQTKDDDNVENVIKLNVLCAVTWFCLFSVLRFNTSNCWYICLYFHKCCFVDLNVIIDLMLLTLVSGSVGIQLVRIQTIFTEKLQKQLKNKLWYTSFQPPKLLLPLSCKTCKCLQAQNSIQGTSNGHVQTPQDGNVKIVYIANLQEISGKTQDFKVNWGCSNGNWEFI